MTKKQPRRSDNHVAGERLPAWHVSYWKERYAVDPHNWPAKRGLLFVRQVTAPVDTESTHYLGQLRDLESLAGDWRQYHVWKSLWEDLRALTATQSRIHQGYLLDEHQQPLKEAQIAARLHADLEETRRALKALSAVNLMERVPLPSFGEIKRAQAKQNESNGQEKASCGAQTRAKKKSCAQDDASVTNATVAGEAKNGPGAVEISDFGPSGGASGPVPAATQGCPLLKGNGLSGNGNLNKKEETTNGSTAGQGQAERNASQAQGEAPDKPSPPTTQPIKPKGAEQEGVADPVRHTGTKPPPPSLNTPAGTIAAVTPVVCKLRIFAVASPPAMSRENDHQWTSDTRCEMKGH